MSDDSGPKCPLGAITLFAIAGICFGRWIPASTAFYGSMSLVVAILWLLRIRGTFWIYITAAFAFIQTAQFRESPAALLANAFSTEWQRACVTGFVSEEPSGTATSSTRRCRFMFNMRTLSIEGKEACRMNQQILVHWIGPPPPYGAHLELVGAMRRLPEPRNPGTFNYAAWFANRSVYLELRVQSRQNLEEHRSVMQALHHGAKIIRTWLIKTITYGVESDRPTVAMVTSIALGEYLPETKALQTAFQRTGTSHLFSVSGLHVSMIAMLGWFFIRLLPVDMRFAGLLTIPMVFFYAFMTGFKAASVRAASMSAIVMVGILIGRTPLVLNSLAAAALVWLLANTNQLFDIGFLLSFSVVAAICILSPRIQKPFQSWITSDPFLPNKLVSPRQQAWHFLLQYLLGTIAMSLAAWIGSLPLTVWNFHLISLSTLLANLVAIPIAFLILITAAASATAGVISTTIASIFNHANLVWCHALIAAVGLFESLPGSYWYVGPSPCNLGEIKVNIFDFSPGACVVIHAEKKTWLLDVGDQGRVTTSVLPYLRSHGIKRIEGVILTHFDSQHVGGTSTLIKEATIEKILIGPPVKRETRLSRECKAACKNYGVPMEIITERKKIEIVSGVTLELLYPPSAVSAQIADDRCLVMRLQSGTQSILFMSDSGQHIEQWLLENATPALSADILVTGHHVSGYSLSSKFLAAVAPQSVIVSACSFPESENISPEWQQILERNGTQLFRQDVTGAIEIRLQPSSVQLLPWLRPEAAHARKAASS